MLMWVSGWLLVCLGIRLMVLLMLLLGEILLSRVFGFLSIFMCLVNLIGIC